MLLDNSNMPKFDTLPNNSSLDDDLEAVKKLLIELNQKDLIVNPCDKPVLTVHGATSTGKSSFINDLVGFPIQVTGNGSVDTAYTIIATVPEKQFQNLYEARLYAEKYSDIEKNPNIQIQNPATRDLEEKRGLCIVDKGQKAYSTAASVGLAGLVALFPDQERVRIIIINEKVYKHENGASAYKLFLNYDSIEDKNKLSSEERAKLATSFVIVDSPGIDAVKFEQDIVISEIRMLTQRALWSLVLIDETSVQQHAVELYMKSLKQIDESGSKLGAIGRANVWDKTSLVLTKAETAEQFWRDSMIVGVCWATRVAN